MGRELNQPLVKLRQLHNQGLLSDDEYQVLVAGMHLAKHQAEVQSGAAAQGSSAIAVGQQGVHAGDNMSGVIITGNVYQGEPTDDPAEAIRIYCRVLAASTNHLPLRGVDIGASDPISGQQPLNIANVYIGLDTTTRAPTNGQRSGLRRLSALEAASSSANRICRISEKVASF